MRVGAVILSAVLGFCTAARAQCIAASGSVEVQSPMVSTELSLPTNVPPLPAGSPTAVSSADAPLSGGGTGGGEGLILIAVAAAVALPVILYVVDSDADAQAKQRYDCTRFRFKVTSGAMNMPSNPSALSPLLGGRVTFARSLLGAEASIESTLDGRSYGAADLHLLLRPPPKQHLEGALAVGVRRVVFGGALRDGIDVALPHRYILVRTESDAFSIDVTPAVFLGFRGVDYRLDAGVSIPLGFTSLQLGGRVFSFDSDVRAGVYLGFGVEA